MKKKHIICLAMAVFLVVCWSAADAAQPKLAKEQILNIAFDAGDLKTLDPHQAASTNDRSAVDPIHNGLVRYPPGDQVKVEPDLAKSWKVSKDNKVWTFSLRKGVYFHPFSGFPKG